MENVNANSFELKCTNYKIGKRLGYMVLKNPH